MPAFSAIMAEILVTTFKVFHEIAPGKDPVVLWKNLQNIVEISEWSGGLQIQKPQQTSLNTLFSCTAKESVLS